MTFSSKETLDGGHLLFVRYVFGGVFLGSFGKVGLLFSFWRSFSSVSDQIIVFGYGSSLLIFNEAQELSVCYILAPVIAYECLS